MRLARPGSRNGLRTPTPSRALTGARSRTASDRTTSQAAARPPIRLEHDFDYCAPCTRGADGRGLRNGGLLGAGAPSVMHVLKRWAALPHNARWAIGTAATLIVIVAIAWALIVPIADWLATHDVGQVPKAVRALRLQTTRDAARGRLLTLGAGVLAAGALWYTGRNFVVSRRTVELSLRTVQLAEQGQVTDRYTKAIEQLGTDKGLDVRIGGIYALERVAGDSPRDHPTMMEVLAAFVREHSREQWPPPADDEPEARASQHTTRPDVQAAITVIGRRTTAHDHGRINLSHVHLHGADLREAKLSGADLRSANLTSANLDRADLADADLEVAILAPADLADANLTRTDLGGARLAGAFFDGATLTDADLSGADLFNASFEGADLTRVNLDDANLTAAIWPSTAEVPEGWQRDTDSGRLKRPESNSGDAAAE
jgi:Pentapeptide repeats (8 copies)